MESKLSNSDKRYIMGTILLECCEAEKLRTDDLEIFEGKSGRFYIISRKRKSDGTPVKVYFKSNKQTF